MPLLKRWERGGGADKNVGILVVLHFVMTSTKFTDFGYDMD